MPALYFFLPFSFAKRSFRSFFATTRSDPPPIRGAVQLQLPRLEELHPLRNAYTSTDFQDRIFITSDDLRDLRLALDLGASAGFLPWTSSASFEQPASSSNSTKPRGPRSATTCRQVRPS